MKKLALVVMVIAVAVMFAGIADAATSSQCGSCAKPSLKIPRLFPQPCGTCAKSCGKCARPCARPCGVCAKPCSPCAPCAPICVEFKRDALGQKVPVYTYLKDGGAMTDKATQYEDTLISGQ